MAQATDTQPFMLRSDVRHEAAAAQLAARQADKEAATCLAAVFRVRALTQGEQKITAMLGMLLQIACVPPDVVTL